MKILLTNSQRWLPLIALFFCFGLFILVQWPIVENIWQYSFDDGTYSHAFLVPLVSGYLYYELWQQNRLQLATKINYFWLLTAIFCSFILIVLTIAQVPFLFRLAWLALITSTTLVLFKPSIAVAFPAIFLIFLLPIWNGLTAILQPLAVAVVTQIMSYTSIPTFVEGNLIYIPDGVFEIAGGCSGVRYFLVAMAISSLFIFLNIRRSKHAILLITIAFLGALVTNWIRITALIVIGHQTQMQSSLMQDHNNFGWFLFIPFMALLFFIGNKLAQKEQKELSPRELPSQSEKTQLRNINKIVLSSVIMVLVASGFYRIKVQDNTPPITVNKHCESVPNNFPQPNIVNFSSSCAQIYSTNTLSILFDFEGNNLDSKADFYQHQYLPDNSTVISFDREPTHEIYLIEWQGNHYWLGVARIVNGQAYGTKLGYLWARITTALHFKQHSQLKWVVHHCGSSCTSQQRANITQYFIGN